MPNTHSTISTTRSGHKRTMGSRKRATSSADVGAAVKRSKIAVRKDDEDEEEDEEVKKKGKKKGKVEKKEKVRKGKKGKKAR